MDRVHSLLDKRVAPRDLEAFCVEAMIRSEVQPEHAKTAAEVLVTTDTWGVFTHGSRQIRPLMRNFRMGGLFSNASPELIGEGPAWALFDGHYAMPMVTSSLAMNTAMEKAKTAGIAYAGVTHSSHFGAAGYYATMALKEDMIGLSMTNVDAWMTVPGARARMLGTNPIAYAVPAGEEKPVFLDIATSVVAITKVLAAKSVGKSIPDNWLVDEDGVPTSDLSEYPQKGYILPMAGYKGYGLAVFIEILSAAMTGAAMLSEVKCWLDEEPQPANEGHAFIAINVGAMMPIEKFKARMDHLIREIKSAPKAKGNDRIYLPGEMEWDKREAALKNGLQLPDYALLNLVGLAADTGLSDEFDRIFK